jgi:hypothetical protein
MGSSERPFRLRGGDAWVAGAALAAAMITLVLMLAAPTGAQNAQAGEGPPAGTPAQGSNPDSPSDTPDLVTISAEGCRVSEGASVTLEDGDGTTARFVDGQSNIEITATNGQIRLEGPNDDFIGDHAVETSDPGFDTDGDYAVVTTTGISCQGTGTPADTDQQPADANAATDQYRAEDKEITVIVETIPDKKILVDTGGPSLAMIGLLVLALGFVGLGIFLLRRV